MSKTRKIRWSKGRGPSGLASIASGDPGYVGKIDGVQCATVACWCYRNAFTDMTRVWYFTVRWDGKTVNNGKYEDKEQAKQAADAWFSDAQLATPERTYAPLED